MSEYLLIRAGIVVNVVTWDGHSKWQTPSDVQVIRNPGGVGIGWTYDGQIFSPPVQGSSK